MRSAKKLFDLWEELYPDTDSSLLNTLLNEIQPPCLPGDDISTDSSWYKDAVIYSLYVDLFNKDIPGLIDKLGYLKDLGVSCLWLLPILGSPMRDAGFDISDYYSIRSDLLGSESGRNLSSFSELLAEAHKRNIRIIFDVAMNHTSDQHNWFKEAKKSIDNQYHNYYIWTKDTHLFKDARIIFKGIESSNWEAYGEEHYFHRFFSFQPDLNYRNPLVLLEMCKVLLYWQQQGVDGFRADAVPYIWKEDGTSCENLPKTHTVVKFFRAMLDYVKPGTLLLAEACQPPADVIEYLGKGDECHAAYHFPLMPRIFIALARENAGIIQETLSPAFTPAIPESTQWCTFLRCHDELSLELVYVSEEERAYIHKNYCHEKLWDFRLGEGISARLSELFLRDPDKILLAFSVVLSLPGTPVIYYGDEVAKLNDLDYYTETIRLTGKDDTRFLVRGRMDWNTLDSMAGNPSSLGSRVFFGLKKMLNIRNQYNIFGRGSLDFITVESEHSASILSYIRRYENKEILIIQNLKNIDISISLPDQYKNSTDLLSSTSTNIVKAHSFQWRIKF